MELLSYGPLRRGFLFFLDNSIQKAGFGVFTFRIAPFDVVNVVTTLHQTRTYSQLLF